MLKRLLPVLICLFAATAASAQMGGGMGGGGMGGGGGHGRGGGRGGSKPAQAPPPTAALSPQAPEKPVNQIEIIGVVRAVDAATGRLTIAYEPSEALGWPAGSQPFPVAKSALLNGVTVGEKVRFSLDSSQIVALRPY